jgi:threonine/homoserine/homoserine lactone efflux protein
LDLDTFLAFLAATALFAYMPGPALLYTAARTIAGGRRAGYFAALGVHAGGYVHVIAAALGLSILFEAVPLAYAALKILGACYLLWLAFGFLRRALAPSPTNDTTSAPPQKSARRAFLDSVLVEALNPKVALFYLAFLPQFVSAEAALSLPLQFLLLGIFVNLAFSSADLIVVLLADKLMGAIKRGDRGRRWLEALGGSILLLLGLRLAFAED